MPPPTSTSRLHTRATIVVLATALAVTAAALLGIRPMARAVDGPIDVVYVATGQDYPDALTGSTLAAAEGAPLLLVTRTTIPVATAQALEALDPNRISVIGGPATVFESVRNQLVAYASSAVVTRLSGANRYATAADVADALPEVMPGKVYHLNISSGATVRTSLTSGPLQGATVSRPTGQAVGHYCVDVPNGLFDVFGTTGVVQSTASTGTAGADNIRIVTTFAGLCQSAGAEIDVRISTDAGALANGYFTLLIPGG